MLDPSWTGQDLGVLELVPGHFVAVMVEDDETGAACSLVQRSHELVHVLRCSFPCLFPQAPIQENRRPGWQPARRLLRTGAD